MGELININNIVDVYLAKPEGDVKGAIIVIHEIWGLNDNIKSIADRFTQEGYIAVAPNLMSDLDFSSVDPDQLAKDLFTDNKREEAQATLFKIIQPTTEASFQEKALNQIQHCFDYLYNIADVHQKIAITGFCFGGTQSFSFATIEPRLKLALPFYGHLNRTIDQVKNIKCPVFAFYGQNDKTLVFDVPKIKDMMDQAGVPFNYKIYDNCGHAFFNDTNPMTYNKEAADDSWIIVLQQLADNLKT